MARWWIGVALTGLLAWRGAGAEVVTHARFDRDVTDYALHRDLTWEATQTIEITLLTQAMVRGVDRLTAQFYPDRQTLEVAQAWVDQPDGTRVAVPPAGISTRQSQASQGAPGFVASLTTTVLFPQVREGSRLHVVWHRTQKVPALLGFNALSLGALEAVDIVTHEVHITAPEEVTLRWGTRGAVTVQTRVEDGIRHVDVTLPQTAARAGERAAVNRWDFEPMFAATSLGRPEEMGALIWRASQGLAEVTPEIAALAERIADERTGIEAARAIHAWVAANIRYVAVYLNPDDGYVPHSASAVLAAGYGDCKDYTVLMQALLAARGIRAQAAILNWGTEYADPPLLTASFGNHEIIYLPDQDRFLNPTDRNAPFDALDRRLSGKNVVLVTPEGRLTRTPASTPAGNTYRYTAQLRLDEAGTIRGRAQYAMSPNAEIGMRAAMNAASSLEDLARRVLSNTREGGFGAFSGSDPRDLLQHLAVTAEWESPMAANTQGRETFLRVPQGMDLRPPTSLREKALHIGPRRTPVLADAEDLGWDTEIALPPGMKPALLPPDVDVSTAVGHYTARYRATDGRIQVSRNLVVDKDVVPAADYPALQELLYAPIVDARAVIALQPAEE